MLLLDRLKWKHLGSKTSGREHYDIVPHWVVGKVRGMQSRSQGRYTLRGSAFDYRVHIIDRQTLYIHSRRRTGTKDVRRASPRIKPPLVGLVRSALIVPLLLTPLLIRGLLILTAIAALVAAAHSWYVRLSPMDASFMIADEWMGYSTGAERGMAKLFLSVNIPDMLQGATHWVSMKSIQSWLWPVVFTIPGILLLWIQATVRSSVLILKK